MKLLDNTEFFTPAKPAPLRNCTLRPFLQTYLLGSGANNSSAYPLAMMYPTAMATAPLSNNNYQYVNMDYQHHSAVQHRQPDQGESAARATSGSRRNKLRSGGGGGGGGGVNGKAADYKSHKTKTRPQIRQKRDSRGWHYETAVAQMDWQSPPSSPQVEVAQLSMARGRSSSRGGSRLNRVINKANLDTGLTSSSSSAGDVLDNDEDENENGDVEEEEEEAVDEIDITSDNDSEVEDEGIHTTDSVLSGRTSEGPTTKNPITSTTRRMTTRGNDNGPEEDEQEAEFGDVTSDESPELNGLPKFSFLRGNNFNNRDPAMQYDSAMIINNNNVNMNRESTGTVVAAEVGVASASTTPTAMELECVAGYDGGLPQFFVLEAYDSRTRKLRLNITSAFPDLPLFRIDMEGTYSVARPSGWVSLLFRDIGLLA